MIILDTDHIVVLKYSQEANDATLTANMAASPDQDFEQVPGLRVEDWLH